jgi:hypothetical protein
MCTKIPVNGVINKKKIVVLPSSAFQYKNSTLISTQKRKVFELKNLRTLVKIVVHAK